jgi:hypothetical protein
MFVAAKKLACGVLAAVCLEMVTETSAVGLNLAGKKVAKKQKSAIRAKNSGKEPGDKRQSDFEERGYDNDIESAKTADSDSKGAYFTAEEVDKETVLNENKGDVYKEAIEDLLSSAEFELPDWGSPDDPGSPRGQIGGEIYDYVGAILAEVNKDDEFLVRKVTGMLLHLQKDELRSAISTWNSLKEKVIIAEWEWQIHQWKKNHEVEALTRKETGKICSNVVVETILGERGEYADKVRGTLLHLRKDELLSAISSWESFKEKVFMIAAQIKKYEKDIGESWEKFKDDQRWKEDRTAQVQQIGDVIYYHIEAILENKQYAGRVTGMLLGLQKDGLLSAISSWEIFRENVIIAEFKWQEYQAKHQSHETEQTGVPAAKPPVEELPLAEDYKHYKSENLKRRRSHSVRDEPLPRSSRFGEIQKMIKKLEAVQKFQKKKELEELVNRLKEIEQQLSEQELKV